MSLLVWIVITRMSIEHLHNTFSLMKNELKTSTLQLVTWACKNSKCVTVLCFWFFIRESFRKKKKTNKKECFLSPLLFHERETMGVSKLLLTLYFSHFSFFFFCSIWTSSFFLTNFLYTYFNHIHSINQSIIDHQSIMTIMTIMNKKYDLYEYPFISISHYHHWLRLLLQHTSKRIPSIEFKNLFLSILTTNIVLVK